MSITLPIHPVTGLKALGYSKRGPIWPVFGGSTDTPPNPVDGKSGDAGVSTDPGSSFVPITSQETLDHIIASRLAREKSKYADYEAVKAKADELDTLKAEQMTELQKAEKRAEQAEQEAAKLRLETLRFQVAGEKNVPVALLAGTTREELEAAADALLSWQGGTQGTTDKGATRNPQQGANPGGKPSARALGEAEAAKRFGTK